MEESSKQRGDILLFLRESHAEDTQNNKTLSRSMQWNSLSAAIDRKRSLFLKACELSKNVIKSNNYFN